MYNGAYLQILIIFTISLLICKLMIRRINNLLAYNKYTHTIYESISIKEAISLNMQNNFKAKKYTTSMYKIIIAEKKTAEKFFKTTKIKKFRTNTNDEIKKILDEFEKKKLIKITKHEDNKICKQQLEKLFLCGIVTIIANLKNKDFWKFVNREENTKTYEIDIIDAKNCSESNKKIFAG